MNVTIDRQNDRQTDRPRYYVCSNGPLSLDAMQPNNSIIV